LIDPFALMQLESGDDSVIDDCLMVAATLSIFYNFNTLQVRGQANNNKRPRAPKLHKVIQKSSRSGSQAPYYISVLLFFYLTFFPHNMF
jgi:hypothetical protein